MINYFGIARYSPQTNRKKYQNVNWKLSQKMLEATYIVSYGEQRAENANHPPTHLTIDISSRKKNVGR